MQIDTSKIPEGFNSIVTPTLNHKIHSIEGGPENAAQQIVMIHGALASRRYLVPTAILLSKEMRVLVPEMPGHGKSSKPPRALSVDEQADVLYEWFKIRGLKNAHIFTNSYGCQVVARLIAKYPELANTIILSDPTVDPKARSWLQEARRFYMDGFRERDGAQIQFLKDVIDMGPVLALETIQRMLDNDIRPNLAKIKCPTLVVTGEYDPISPEAWNQEVAARIANAQLRVIPNAPHCLNYATPHQLTRLLLEFIDQSQNNGNGNGDSNGRRNRNGHGQ